MEPERWRQVDEILGAALEREAHQRGAFLAQACAGDGELRREVESLLAAVESSSDLDRPPSDLAASLVADRRRHSMLGRRIGRYEILSLLGVGGMGEVYRAKDTPLGRDVAIKILPEASAAKPQALARFRQEAQVIAALSHPSILAIHDVGSEGDLHYAVTELLEGETLRSCLSRGPLPWPRALEIAVAIAEGLVAAHAKGVVHRDLKPGNIFLTSNGGVKILDFGIARTLARSYGDLLPATGLEMTKPGALLGTVLYMSPEQVRGEPVEPSSDIFSLGCVLYEMLTGAKPFARGSPADSMAAILNDEPDMARLRGRSVAPSAEDLLRRCLAKSRSARFSASELAAAVSAALQLPAAASPVAQPSATSRTQIITWNRIAWPIAAALVLASASIPFIWNRYRAIDSIAVLPIANTSGDPELQYLSEGMTETLINALSELPTFKKVIARESVFRYGGQVDPQVVARELGVIAVLTGRVVKKDDTVVISAELSDGRDNRHLWGERYSRKLTEVVSAEQEIVAQILENLRMRLDGEARKKLDKHYAVEHGAYDLYLRGLYYRHKSSREEREQAIAYFKQAIEKYPGYAPAYAGLATAYYMVSNWWMPPTEVMPQAKSAALKALDLNPDLAEANTVLGVVIAFYEWSWTPAEQYFKHAIELSPGNAEAHLWYGTYLMFLGRFDQATRELNRARELDPLSVTAQWHAIRPLFYRGRYDQAIEQLRTLISLHPDAPEAYSLLGECHAERGEFAAAVAALSRARAIGGSPWVIAALGRSYAKYGEPEKAQRILEELSTISAHTYVSPYAIATVHAALGEPDRAFAYLDRSYQERCEDLVELKVDPRMAQLRGDPRYAQALRGVGLAAGP